MAANGYRPIWVDGYDINGQTYFNVIFDKSAGGAWVAAHGLSGSAYLSFGLILKEKLLL